MKAQIEKDDILLKINDEKQTVIGEIDEQQRKQLQELLSKYQDVIAKEGELGQTKVYKHRIIRRCTTRQTKSLPNITY